MDVTVSGRLTWQCQNLNDLSVVLAKVQASPKCTNVVSDSNALTVTADFSDTEPI